MRATLMYEVESCVTEGQAGVWKACHRTMPVVPTPIDCAGKEQGQEARQPTSSAPPDETKQLRQQQQQQQQQQHSPPDGVSHPSFLPPQALPNNQQASGSPSTGSQRALKAVPGMAEPMSPVAQPPANRVVGSDSGIHADALLPPSPFHAAAGAFAPADPAGGRPPAGSSGNSTGPANVTAEVAGQNAVRAADSQQGSPSKHMPEAGSASQRRDDVHDIQPTRGGTVLPSLAGGRPDATLPEAANHIPSLPRDPPTAGSRQDAPENPSSGETAGGSGKPHVHPNADEAGSRHHTQYATTTSEGRSQPPGDFRGAEANRQDVSDGDQHNGQTGQQKARKPSQAALLGRHLDPGKPAKSPDKVPDLRRGTAPPYGADGNEPQDSSRLEDRRASDPRRLRENRLPATANEQPTADALGSSSEFAAAHDGPSMRRRRLPGMRSMSGSSDADSDARGEAHAGDTRTSAHATDVAFTGRRKGPLLHQSFEKRRTQSRKIHRDADERAMTDDARSSAEAGAESAAHFSSAGSPQRKGRHPLRELNTQPNQIALKTGRGDDHASVPVNSTKAIQVRPAPLNPSAFNAGCILE